MDKIYQVIITTRKEWEKDWPERLRKGQVWFTDRTCNQQEGEGRCKSESKRQLHISLGW